MDPDKRNVWLDAQVGRFDVADSAPAEVMTEKHRKSATGQDVAIALVRVVLALVFAARGVQKLLGFFGTNSDLHTPLLLTIGAVEALGGLLIALGLFTRPVALLLCGMGALAYFMVHMPEGTLFILNSAALTGLYCLFFLFLAVRGPGIVSLDGMRN
jgi:putative oxidoreductase